MSASLPNVIPALQTVLQGALPANFEVVFGTVMPVYIAAQSCIITGARFTMDNFAVLGPDYTHEEQYGLSCSLTSSYGNNDEFGRLNEVYGLYKDISVAIANNPTLNSTVRVAWTTQNAYTPGKDIKGLDVGRLDFTVKVQVRVQSLT